MTPILVLLWLFLSITCEDFQKESKEPDYEQFLDGEGIHALSLVQFSGPGAVCGWHVIEGKIVGGREVTRGEFPSLLSLRNEGIHVCGASLISPRFALTAAHCLVNKVLGNIDLAFRDFQLSRREEDPEEYILRPEKAIIHAGFVKETYDNDIALLQFPTTIQYDDFALPACLPSNKHVALAGTNAVIVGWGRASEDAPKDSDVPNKVEIPITTMAECVAALGEHNINEDKFCAGYISGEKDACQGDSGGPLFVNVNGLYIQMGIISSGIGCARTGVLGLYTRLSSFAPWILKGMRRAMGEDVEAEELSIFELMQRHERQSFRRNPFLPAHPEDEPVFVPIEGVEKEEEFAKNEVQELQKLSWEQHKFQELVNNLRERMDRHFPRQHSTAKRNTVAIHKPWCLLLCCCLFSSFVYKRTTCF